MSAFEKLFSLKGRNLFSLTQSQQGDITEATSTDGNTPPASRIYYSINRYCFSCVLLMFSVH